MTIYDIAREAGVSASTVSRVINNKAGIKESTRKKVQKLLDEYNYTPDVDGILCATDMLAIGCVQELKQQGIAVPEQVAVIGVDNTLYGQLCTPALTTLDNKLGEVSLAAANMLLDVLQERPVSHKLMLLTEIIQREST